MDEFLVALMSGAALICYTILSKLLFESQYQVYFRWGLFLLIAILIIAYVFKRRLDKKRFTKLGIDAENYMYYEKYTSFGNKLSYVVTYLLQDFVYEVKKRNKSYNFSKGMFRFDDSLGEYYIDCRIGWYAYFKINILKNRLSLHKLRIFSLTKCNEMLLSVFPEQAELYKQIKEEMQNKVDEFPVGKKLGYIHVNEVTDAMSLYQDIRWNLLEMEISRKFMRDNMDVYHEYLKKQDKRKDDVREIKNLYIDINKKN